MHLGSRYFYAKNQSNMIPNKQTTAVCHSSKVIKWVRSSNQLSYPNKSLSKFAYWDQLSLCQKSVRYVIKQGNDSKFSFFISDEKRKTKRKEEPDPFVGAGDFVPQLKKLKSKLSINNILTHAQCASGQPSCATYCLQSLKRTMYNNSMSNH